MLRNKHSYSKQVDATYERTQISPRKLHKTGHYLTEGTLIRDVLILKRSQKSDRATYETISLAASKLELH